MGAGLLTNCVELRSALDGGEGVALEQRADLGLAVPAVAAESADRGELAGLGPPGDRLRVDAEQRRHFGRGEERLGLGTLTWSRHGVPLSWGFRKMHGSRCPVALPRRNTGPGSAFRRQVSISRGPFPTWAYRLVHCVPPQ